jgi:hypothetical protein
MMDFGRKNPIVNECQGCVKKDFIRSFERKKAQSFARDAAHGENEAEKMHVDLRFLYRIASLF